MMINSTAEFNVPGHKHLVTMRDDTEGSESSKLATKCRRCPIRRSSVLNSFWSSKLRRMERKTDLTECSRISTDEKVVPICDKKKPAEVRILRNDTLSEEIFQVYQPGYTPNPFEDFMMKM